VNIVGSGPRVVLVHGQMTTGAQTWAKQMPLAERWTLVVPELLDLESEHPGRSDFEIDAKVIAPLLEDGAHLVGHSYGGIIAMYAAALAPEAVRSLALIETPASALVRGDPDVEALIEDYEERARTIREPEAFARGFFESIGVDVSVLPSPFPPPMARMAWLLMTHRVPWEADLPVGELKSASFPKLVISGGHAPSMERTSDVLADRLGAHREIISGRGHLVQRTDAFNDVLERFMLEAS
jgi:pimeloyl-ACP methyl ester carboxylesterase